ncbi:MAG: hypothetical protein CSA11_01600 [Chloroflexi bacterium]|nr:MAG: hypothetical protein CSA11_01600 [Chloroflexota bacterium]
MEAHIVSKSSIFEKRLHLVTRLDRFQPMKTNNEYRKAPNRIPLLVSLGTIIGVVLVFLLVFVSGEAQAQDATVRFINSSVNVSEAVGTLQVVVRMEASGLQPGELVTIDYESLYGSASGGDFTSVNSSLTFSTTQVTRTIAIAIINDSEYEQTEFFYVELKNPSSNAALADPYRIQIFINDNDPRPSSTATPSGVVYLDAYEPNNSFSESYSVGVGSRACNITFWPSGDVDYFHFFAKRGSTYRVYTNDLSPGMDTVLTLYDSSGQEVARNDDVGVVGTVRSEIQFTAGADGFYYAYITNKDPSDPTGKTYCFGTQETEPPTPTPSNTPVAGADECEYNSTVEYACIIAKDVAYSMSFVPVLGSAQDTDYFWLWIKSGSYYSCETLNLSPYADTNMIFLDQNGNDFAPKLGNDDKEPGDYGSKLTILAPYTGYLSIVVGPVNPPPYEESSLHTYELLCTELAVTPTPIPTETRPWVPPASGGAASTATPTPSPTAQTATTPTTTFDPSSIFLTLTPAPPPQVQINPLPTPTPEVGGGSLATVNVTLFYDSNDNFMPELTEGIVDVAVALYDNATGQPLAFGFTNETGSIRFENIAATGALRVSVPYLNYSQIVFRDEANILIRVAPQQLPGQIP